MHGIALGGCVEAAERLPALAARLRGLPATPALASLILPRHLAHLQLLDDFRAPATYRRHVAVTPLRRGKLDAPPIECILVEDPEPLGPSGAKGVGEPALVPTAAAMVGAIRNATGFRAVRLPLLPHRLKAA